jgi:hypothetical protein
LQLAVFSAFAGMAIFLMLWVVIFEGSNPVRLAGLSAITVSLIAWTAWGVSRR